MGDMPWPADRVERRSLESLIPYARNSRSHSEAQIAQVAASMREWGWTNPVLVDEQGTIIAGHARVAAARLLGLTEAPVMVARGWSEAQKSAYVIADNKLALNASWDDALLASELQTLQQADFALGLTGFDDASVGRLLSQVSDGLTDPDDVPDPPNAPFTKPGDVWQLGRHRLVCGDATDPNIVAKALQGGSPSLMVTDPPYGVNYQPAWRNTVRPSKGTRTKTVANDDRADWRDAWALFPGDVAYVWHGGLHAATVAESLVSAGFEIRSQIIWVKERMVLSRGDYHWQHEPCWYAVRGKSHWSGDRSQTSVWRIPQTREDAETTHSTQKPVEAMRRPILNNTKPGEAVYDPFCGSGTTLIAAEQTGRACVAIELDPACCDVAVERWQAFTGEVAEGAI
ncbi:MAG: site-specific DNA-methyltransferase [Azospirillaceae bacterium]